MARKGASSLHHRLAWGLVLVGTGLRLHAYLRYLPLHVDEQLLALNIASRSFRELLAPLSLGQSAPPLFLWLERCAVMAGGVSEWTLRAVPLLAGVITLPLAWRVARSLLGSGAAVIAVGLLAVSPLLVYESAFVKPYALDALVTVVLLQVGLSAAERLRTWRDSIGLMATGAVAVAMSLPSVFTLAAIGPAAVLPAWGRRDRVTLGRATLVGGVWGLAFLATLAVSQRGLVGGGLTGMYMGDFWERTFLIGQPPGLLQRMRNIAADVFRGVLAGEPAFFPQAVAIPAVGVCFGLVAVIGLVGLIRRSQTASALVLALPLLLATFASSLRLYPMAPRLMLWAAPLVAYLVAQGATSLVASVPTRRKLITDALAMTLLVPGALAAAQTRDTRGLHELLAGVPEADTVYVYPGGIPAWLYYSTDWRQPDRARIRWGMRHADLGGASVMFRWRLYEQIDRAHTSDSALAYASGTRVEMLGRSSGLDFVHETQRWARTTETGWAAHEASRMRNAGTPCTSLLLIHVDPIERAGLHDAIREASGEILPIVQQPAAYSFVERVCFPRADANTGRVIAE